MGLWTLLEGLVLLANAFAILNEDRFLAPRGWGFSEVSAGGRTKTLKGQLMGLIYATQLKSLHQRCSKEMDAYAGCMYYNTNEFEMCRKEQEEFEKACPLSL